MVSKDAEKRWIAQSYGNPPYSQVTEKRSVSYNGENRDEDGSEQNRKNQLGQEMIV